MRLLPVGDAAVLVEFDRPEAVLPFAAALRERPHPSITDVVPAERTVLVRFPASPSDPTRPARIARWLRSVNPDSQELEPGPLLRLDVVYDGADLAEVAASAGLSLAEVIAAHAGIEWVVAFSGFAPGFGYLRPGAGQTDGAAQTDGAGRADASGMLRVPRRSEPRVRVPAGAVALAAGYSGVYPRASPGGWQLIGRTDATLWDADRDPPALLRPGVRVRFRPVEP